MQFAFGKFDFNSSKEPPDETRRFCHVEKRTVSGRNVFTLSSRLKKSSCHILYLHGGAYVQNFVKQHWKFLAMLVKETHCTITAPDYPLAPKSTFHDAYAMVIPLYKEIIAKAGEENTILMGDSAGGGFALGLAQKMRVDGNTSAGKIILLSPWLDAALDNPEILKIDQVDPFLSATALRKAGLVFSGGCDLSNPMLSPINGSLEGLGEISVFIGSCDLLAADARKLRDRAKQQSIPLNYREYPDMVHVWMLLNFRESKEARREIFDLIVRYGQRVSQRGDRISPART